MLGKVIQKLDSIIEINYIVFVLLNRLIAEIETNVSADSRGRVRVYVRELKFRKS